MKNLLKSAKVPFGTAKFSKIKNVRYLSWEDVFDVEFEDGLCILEHHSTVRRANKISSKARFSHVEIENWCQSGFFVHYDNGQVAEVSWAFIRELRPKTPAKLNTSSQRLRSVALLLALFQSLWFGAQAQTPINTGSDGHDGALNPTTSIVIDMADHPDGIYHYTSVNIRSGVEVSFIPNANNSPVVWLVQAIV